MYDQDMGTSGVCRNSSTGRSSMKLRGSSHSMVPGILILTMWYLRTLSIYSESTCSISLNSNELFSMTDFSSSSPYRSIDVLNLFRANAYWSKEQLSGNYRALNIFWLGVYSIAISQGSTHSGQFSLLSGSSPQKQVLSFQAILVYYFAWGDTIFDYSGSIDLPRRSSIYFIVSSSLSLSFLAAVQKNGEVKCMKEREVMRSEREICDIIADANQLQQRDQAHQLTSLIFSIISENFKTHHPSYKIDQILVIIITHKLVIDEINSQLQLPTLITTLFCTLSATLSLGPLHHQKLSELTLIRLLHHQEKIINEQNTQIKKPKTYMFSSFSEILSMFE